MSFRILKLTSSALASGVVVSFGATAAAEDAADAQPLPDKPAASTEMMPEPSLTEQIVYLRDALALQTLRLDEAEQTQERLTKLVDLQEQRIKQLEQQLASTSASASAATKALAEIQETGSISDRTYASLPQGTRQYRVKSGDTLGRIARDNNTTVRTLARANNLRSPYRLSIGQRLVMPGAPAPAAVGVASAPADQLPQEPKTATASKASPAPQKVAATESAGQSGQARTEDQQPSRRDDAPDNSETRVAAADRRRDAEGPGEGLPQEIGQRPSEERDKPYIALFSDVGGILTPRGTLYMDQGISYTTSSDNRFFFQGTEILDSILIGAIEATDSDRQAVTGSLGLRYGVTSRLEVDARASYVYRDDRVSGTVTSDNSEFLRDLSGNGLGDIEAGIHYQLNQGKKFPYTIFNLRGKAPTGQGPFDVERNASGNETELATGSGFWTIEPSLTFIIPSAPASVFANIGYQANLKTSPNQIVDIIEQEEFVGNVVDDMGSDIIDPDTGEPIPIFNTLRFQDTLIDFDPGDAIRASLGVGLSLNEKLSINFGYDQSYFFDTNSTIERIELTDLNAEPVRRHVRRNSVTSGSFRFGGSYSFNDRMRLNLNTAFGATDEAPDMRIGLRLQIKMFGDD